MNCAEAGDKMPLYLSGEMDREEGDGFAAHLALCPECAAQMEHQQALDARVRRAAAREPVDTSRVERNVRRHLAAARTGRQRIAAGAVAAAIAVAFSYGVTRAPRLYVDAARDHRIEVMEGQQRRWRFTRADMGALAARNDLSFEQAASLAPAGYMLERAKTCGLDGQRMLHLVFANGARKVSIYVRPDRRPQEHVRVMKRDAEQVAGFETGRFRAVVVSDGPASECKELAGFAAARL